MNRRRLLMNTMAGLAVLAGGGLLGGSAAGQKGPKPPPQPPPPAPVPTQDRIIYDLSCAVGGKGNNTVYETDIFWMNTNGTGKTRLSAVNGYNEGCAVWSPDGRRIAYKRAALNSFRRDDVYVMNADGSVPTPVIDTPSWYGMPAWSPVGDYLAVEDSPAGSFRVLLVKPDRTGLMSVLEIPNTSGTLGDVVSWSPDLDPSTGYQGLLLFGFAGPAQAWECRGLRVDIINGVATAPNGARLVDSISVLPQGTSSRCYWSPDGARIAWPSGGVIHIADVLRDGGGAPALPISLAKVWANYPAMYSTWGWSPDSQNLIGTSLNSGGWSTGLYRFAVPAVLFPFTDPNIPAPGATPQRLGTDAGDRPCWSPAVF